MHKQIMKRLMTISISLHFTLIKQGVLQHICCSSLHTVLNSTCSDFYHGTALHIAASNLCLGAVNCLLEHGANPSVRVSMMIYA